MSRKQRKQITTLSSLEKILKWGIIIVIAVLPLLYFPGRIASYVTSKEYFLIGTVDMLLVVWVWLLLKDIRYRLSKQTMLWLAPSALFLLSMTVSAIAGVDPATSFFSVVESGTGLILLYHCFLFAVMAASFIRVHGQSFVTRLFQATFFASVILAISTFFTGGNGLVDLHSEMLNKSSGGAMMGNSLLAGAYFIFSIFLTIVLLTKETVAWKKVMYLGGIALIVFSPIYFNAALFKGSGISSSYLFIGQARIAFVALMTGLLLSLCIWLWTSTDKVRRSLGIAGIAVMVVVGCIAGQSVITPTSKLHAFFVQESGNRIVDWQASVQGIKEKPLLGWGPENFHVVYQRYFDPIVFSPGHGNEAWSLHPHNNSFEVLVDGGIIGGLAYLILIIALFWGIWKLYRKGTINGSTYALLTAMMIAFIIQQQMVYDSIVSYTMFFLVIAIVAGLSDGASNTESARKIQLPLNPQQQAIVWALLIIMIPVWLYGAYLPARKMEEFQSIASKNSDQRGPLYQHLFNSAGSYSINTDPEFYTEPLFYSYATNREVIKNNADYRTIASTELADLIAAVDPLWQNNHQDYHLSLSLVQLENLYWYLSDDSQALMKADVYATRGFALSQNDPQLYVDYAQTMVDRNNIPAAIALLDKAIALSPYYSPAVSFRKQLQ